MARTKQLELRCRTWGGKRKGAGRKPRGERAGGSHTLRARFSGTLPPTVTVRMASHVYNLRSRRCFSVVGRAIAAAAERFGVRIVQFSVQGNHVHLVVEAASNEALSRAMTGFSIRVAKGLNRVMRCEGRVLGDRYHAHVLRPPREVRRTLRYVRENFRKHAVERGESLPAGFRDPYSSSSGAIALPSPATWLLRVGWQRASSASITFGDELPRPRSARAPVRSLRRE